jgi:phosphopantothenoylcysteine decarboxylase/phosphopantothenate--cysteine ligase
MHGAVRAELDSSDVLIMAAAVADYRAKQVSENKLKKLTLGSSPSIELTENADILADAARHSRCLAIGFAAETTSDDDELIAVARQKAAAKGAAAIVANRVGPDLGIGTLENSVVIVAADGRELGRAQGDKLFVAQGILDAIVQLRG